MERNYLHHIKCGSSKINRIMSERKTIEFQTTIENDISSCISEISRIEQKHTAL